MPISWSCRLLVLDPATGNRSRKMPQMPSEKILDAAHRCDRSVQGVIRNGYRNETPGEQESGEHIHGLRDLNEVPGVMRRRRRRAYRQPLSASLSSSRRGEDLRRTLW